MAVVENVGSKVDNSLNRTESLLQSDIDHSKSNGAGNLTLRSGDQNNLHTGDTNQLEQQQKMSNGTAAEQMSSVKQHNHLMKGDAVYSRRNGGDNRDNGDGGEAFKQEMKDLEEMLSKLNPMAEEFVPPSFANYTPFLQNSAPPASQSAYFPDTNFVVLPDSPVPGGNSGRRKKIGYSHGKRRMNSRTSMAQSEEVIRRTVYVSDIDHQVTEEQLAALFISCGQVVDCRICGDPNSVLRFAFVEFTDEDGARNALSLEGTMLGFYPVKVLPSKTAIAPVNPTFLPRSEDEREMCARTVYCANIDKKVTQADVKLFFESVCGKVFRLRLLGDYHHSTRIAFVEFVDADSAIAALNCSGVILGSLPIRVSPSKTPVRQRGPRAAMY